MTNEENSTPVRPSKSPSDPDVDMKDASSSPAHSRYGEVSRPKTPKEDSKKLTPTSSPANIDSTFDHLESPNSSIIESCNGKDNRTERSSSPTTNVDKPERIKDLPNGSTESKPTETTPKVHEREGEDEGGEPLAKRVKTEQKPLQNSELNEPEGDLMQVECTTAARSTPTDVLESKATTANEDSGEHGDDSGGEEIRYPNNNCGGGVPTVAQTGDAGTSTNLVEIMTLKHFDSEPITEVQHKYILEQLRKAKKTKNGMWFAEPVDPVKMNLPTYFDLVKRPMDLSTIETKLKDNVYNSTDNLMEDFDLMIDNCALFNGAQHQVTLAGYALKVYFVKLLSLLPSRDQVVASKKFQKPPAPSTRPPQPRRGSRLKSTPVAPSPVPSSTLTATAATPMTPASTSMSTSMETITPSTACLPTTGSTITAAATPASAPATTTSSKNSLNTTASTAATATAVTSSLGSTAATSAISPGSSGTFALDPNGVPLIRRDSSVTNRPKREIHRPPPRDLPYSSVKPKKKKYALELKFAERVISELFKSKHSAYSFPFLQPVDPVALNIPDYHKVIKKPMDFGTIAANLKSNFYGTAKEVYADAQQVFANCFKYNAEGSHVHVLGQRLQAVFESEWSQKDAWINDNTPVSEPEPELTEEDDEDEDEEDEDEAAAREQNERTAKLLAIQEQIARLTEQSNKLIMEATQMGALSKRTSFKKTSGGGVLPRGHKKDRKMKNGKDIGLSKSGSGNIHHHHHHHSGGLGSSHHGSGGIGSGVSGNSKRASSGVAGGGRGGGDGMGSGISSKKASSKTKKIPAMTLDQKREIAEFIGTLDSLSSEMQHIIQVIRSGMPSMKDESDEIELSVDEIPNHILYELYQYVRQLQGLPVNPPPPPPPAAPCISSLREMQGDAFFDFRDEEDVEYRPRGSVSGKRGSGRAGRGGGSSRGGRDGEISGRKKSRTSKLDEQESKIQEMTATLARFQQRVNSGTAQPAPAADEARLDESSDDVSDSESEEE